MRLVQYKNKILKIVRGHLPTPVFIWYVILLWALMLAVGGTLLAYYFIFNIKQSTNNLEINDTQKKFIINKEELQDTLKIYGL